MIKRLPSLNRPNSARRYIPPPNPVNAAIYQKVLIREAGKREQFYHKNRTSEQFVDDIENYIEESLLQAKDDFAAFKVYQNAFNYKYFH